MLVIVDVRPDTEGLPVSAYQSIQTVTTGVATSGSSSAGAGASAADADGSSGGDVATQRTFAHVTSEVGAYEAEEVRRSLMT